MREETNVWETEGKILHRSFHLRPKHSDWEYLSVLHREYTCNHDQHPRHLCIYSWLLCSSPKPCRQREREKEWFFDEILLLTLIWFPRKRVSFILTKRRAGFARSLKQTNAQSRREREESKRRTRSDVKASRRMTEISVISSWGSNRSRRFTSEIIFGQCRSHSVDDLTEKDPRKDRLISRSFPSRWTARRGDLLSTVVNPFDDDCSADAKAMMNDESMDDQRRRRRPSVTKDLPVEDDDVDRRNAESIVLVVGWTRTRV